MLASQLENAEDKHPSRRGTKEDVSIEQEIECPRSHDLMTLHSELSSPYKGIVGDDNGLIYSTDMVCNNKWRIESGGLYHLGCDAWKILTVTPDHMEFKDQRGGTIRLMRNG